MQATLVKSVTVNTNSSAFSGTLDNVSGFIWRVPF
jgi:hypothetical protein